MHGLFQKQGDGDTDIRGGNSPTSLWIARHFQVLVSNYNAENIARNKDLILYIKRYIYKRCFISLKISLHFFFLLCFALYRGEENKGSKWLSEYMNVLFD